ncbi:DUF169 domain-containing protein [Pyrobaculum ferrireducens]|uniref:DUF169 domain-containing protein n=1 Tax=Pyrobaculum ferrireducens TaxID=1104324 RepID=G7VFD0_9CREN|nr:DUF169 domain-containing protein [Pyrobaculum ferrireducens]AET32936.1 hypothetical protein P186_1517 [Pyrobaculum ferrireducens]
MASLDEIRQQGSTLRGVLGLATWPIGIRFCSRGEQCGGSGFKRPYRDLGIRVAFCQAINIARTYGWKLAIGLEDSYCMIGAEALGLTKTYLDYIDRDIPKWHTSDKGAMERIVSVIHARFLEPGSTELVLISPLDRIDFEPHVVVIYGLPAQIATVAKALIWNGVVPGEITYIGMASCTLIPYSHKYGKVQINIPGTGELILGRTESHEMSIVIPAKYLHLIIPGIEAVKKIHLYPLAKFSLYEPKVPKWYEELTFDYYKKSVDQ